MTYKGTANGKVIELDEPLPLPAGQRITVSVQADTPRIGSPAAVLQAMRQGPRVSHEDVAALEEAIKEGQLPIRYDSPFEEGAP